MELSFPSIPHGYGDTKRIEVCVAIWFSASFYFTYIKLSSMLNLLKGLCFWETKTRLVLHESFAILVLLFLSTFHNLQPLFPFSFWYLPFVLVLVFYATCNVRGLSCTDITCFFYSLKWASRYIHKIDLTLPLCQIKKEQGGCISAIFCTL